jgi:predicted RND superfamily exporter protein
MTPLFIFFLAGSDQPLQPASSNQSSTGPEHDFRDRIEHGFASWGRFTTRHPWLVMLACFAIIGGICTQLSKLYMDTSIEVFLHEDDPIRIAYNDFRYQFGREERIIVIIDSDESIFTAKNLERLKNLHLELEREVPKLQEVLSLYNARLTIGKEDELIVRDLLEEWPETSEEIAALRELVMNHPTFRDQFVGLDDKTIALFIETDAYTSVGQDYDALQGFDDGLESGGYEGIEFDGSGVEAQAQPNNFISGEENNEIVYAVNAVLEKHERDDFRLTPSGTPHMNTLLMTILMNDMGIFTIASLFAIGIILAFLFRRLVMVFAPLFISMLAIMVTFAIMAFIGIPFTVLTQICPSFLLAVGVGNSVHIFAIFFQSLQKGMDKHESISQALRHSGFAIAMTAFTTAGGLMSFSQADIKPIADFGITSAIGIVVVFCLSITLLPALISVLPIKRQANHTPENHLNQRFLTGCARLAANKPWHIVFVSACLIAITLWSALQLRPTHDPLKWFKEGHPFRHSMERLNDEFGGGMFLEIVIDTGKENGLHNPALLRKIEDVYSAVYRFESNGIRFHKAISILDINKELHQALNSNDPAFYAIPDNQQLIAQELLLFENSGSDDLENFTDTRLSKARITLRIPYVEATNYEAVEKQLYPEVREIIGDMGEVQFTGLMAIDIETTPAMVRSLVSSYFLAFMVITPLMMIMLRSIKTGLISMIPNLIPILITLGFMQATGIPLEAFTLLIGCIALGLAVDDTIHFMHNFERYYRQTGSPEQAAMLSLSSTGQALLFTTIVLTVAFYIYMLSSMSNLFNFGLLTGSCIALAFIGDVLLAPALLILKTRREQRLAAAA